MASRKQFYKLEVFGGMQVSRRNSTVGGTIIGDYLSETGARIVVVEMPKVAVKKVSRKKSPVAQSVADAVKRQDASQSLTEAANPQYSKAGV